MQADGVHVLQITPVAAEPQIQCLRATIDDSGTTTGPRDRPRHEEAQDIVRGILVLTGTGVDAAVQGLHVVTVAHLHEEHRVLIYRSHFEHHTRFPTCKF